MSVVRITSPAPAMRDRRTMRSASDLAAAGLIGDTQRAALDAVAQRYAVAVTPAVADLMDPADPNDPIARQFVPQLAELTTAPHELVDPIGDEAHSPVEGVVHRYPDRALLKLLHACAVYCRFCFRRETVGPGGASSLSSADFDRALATSRRSRKSGKSSSPAATRSRCRRAASAKSCALWPASRM